MNNFNGDTINTAEENICIDNKEENYNCNNRCNDRRIKNAYINDNVRFYLDTYSNHPILTFEEEIALAKRIEKGDKEAVNELFNNNLKLVVSRAKIYSGYIEITNFTIMDLIQSGNLGLLKAIEKFDYRLGTKFSTYAVWWIDQSINRSIVNNGKMIRVPVNMTEKSRKIRRMRNDYIVKYKVAPTSLELYEYVLSQGMNVSWNDFQVLIMPEGYYSLDSKIEEDENSTLEMYISDPNDMEKSILDEITINQAMEFLFRIIRNSYSGHDIERNIEIFKYINGLVDGETKTLAEVGEMYNLTRERVRQINDKIMTGIRKIVKNKAESLNIGELSLIENITEVLYQCADDYNTDIENIKQHKTYAKKINKI